MLKQARAGGELETIKKKKKKKTSPSLIVYLVVKSWPHILELLTEANNLTHLSGATDYFCLSSSWEGGVGGVPDHCGGSSALLLGDVRVPSGMVKEQELASIPCLCTLCANSGARCCASSLAPSQRSKFATQNAPTQCSANCISKNQAAESLLLKQGKHCFQGTLTSKMPRNLSAGGMVCLVTAVLAFVFLMESVGNSSRWIARMRCFVLFVCFSIDFTQQQLISCNLLFS